jgi:hypothetical protein
LRIGESRNGNSRNRGINKKETGKSGTEKVGAGNMNRETGKRTMVNNGRGIENWEFKIGD